ncbi:MCE family protein [Nocardioides sp. W3-2-3]|uniref:MlaD family protein n=1 Tax=Nocardioides convexus TaxID=2712224 RepID=UPI0024181F01|nr:MlaD family protein [Nocardioides convexus]NHA01785.1 MCE family protein [Nocardioides convexus]
MESLDLQRIQRAVDVLATDLKVTPDALRDAVDGIAGVSAMVTGREQQIDDLLSSTRAVTSLVLRQTDALDRVMTNGTAVMLMVQQRKETLRVLLRDAHRFVTGLTTVVRRSAPQARPGTARPAERAEGAAAAPQGPRPHDDPRRADDAGLHQRHRRRSVARRQRALGDRPGRPGLLDHAGGLQVRRRTVLAALGGVLVLALALSGARLAGWLGGEDPGDLVVTADFADTTGVYVGNDVTYLGVRIGEIVEVRPRGTTMRVVMHLAPGSRVPRDAGAEILQGSLVTDRFIEARAGLGRRPHARHRRPHRRRPHPLPRDRGRDREGHRRPRAGARLRARQGQGRGRSRRPARHHRECLEGQRRPPAPGAGREPRRARRGELQGRRPDRGLEEPGPARHRVCPAVTAASATSPAPPPARPGSSPASARSLVATLGSLDRLTRLTTDFLRRNGSVLGADLAGLADVVDVVRDHQDSLSEAFDVMPTMAENFSRAYDWDLGRLRVQFAFSAGPFSAAFRSHTCLTFAGTLGPAGSRLCGLLFTSDGTGALDPLLDGLYDGLPGGIP